MGILDFLLHRIRQFRYRCRWSVLHILHLERSQHVLLRNSFGIKLCPMYHRVLHHQMDPIASSHARKRGYRRA